MKTKTTGIYKDSKGKWYIDTKVKVDGVYKHFHKGGYTTLAEAKCDYENAKQEFIFYNTHKSTFITFDELIDEYKKMRKATVGQATYNSDNYVYNIYLKDMFGLTLDKCFSVEFIKRWYSELVNNPNNSQEVKYRTITRIKDILEFAYLHEYINLTIKQGADRNIYKVKYDKSTQKEKVIWTSNDEHAFFNAVKENKKDFIMFSLFFSFGMRIGEFLALQPKHFDLINGNVKVCQQAISITGQRQVITETLKSKQSYRVVMFNQNFIPMIKEYISDFGIQDNEFMFFNRDKTQPMARTTFRRKLNLYCDKAGVGRINPHLVRHFLAVKLSQVATSVELVEVASSMLGHTPTMFMNTYANHTKLDKQKELLEKINA